MVQKGKAEVGTSQVEVEASPSSGPSDAGSEAPGSVEEPRSIGVELSGRRKFISGVVEGEQNIYNVINKLRCFVIVTVFVFDAYRICRLICQPANHYFYS